MKKMLTRDEVTKIIDVWEEHAVKLKGSKLNLQIYTKISEILDQTHGIALTPIETRMKIRGFLNKYRQEKKLAASSGQPSEWIYYDRIHNLQTMLKEDSISENISSTTPNSREYLFVSKPTSPTVQSPSSAQHVSGSSLSAKLSSSSSTPSSSKPPNKYKNTIDKLINLSTKDQKQMEDYLKKSLENDAAMINIMEKNNNLLETLITKLA